jgi:chloramphenicol 3-O-phosphotransferase
MTSVSRTSGIASRRTKGFEVLMRGICEAPMRTVNAKRRAKDDRAAGLDHRRAHHVHADAPAG